MTLTTDGGALQGAQTTDNKRSKHFPVLWDDTCYTTLVAPTEIWSQKTEDRPLRDTYKSGWLIKVTRATSWVIPGRRTTVAANLRSAYRLITATRRGEPLGPFHFVPMLCNLILTASGIHASSVAAFFPIRRRQRNVALLFQDTRPRRQLQRRPENQAGCSRDCVSDHLRHVKWRSSETATLYIPVELHKTKTSIWNTRLVGLYSYSWLVLQFSVAELYFNFSSFTKPVHAMVAYSRMIDKTAHNAPTMHSALLLGFWVRKFVN